MTVYAVVQSAEGLEIDDQKYGTTSWRFVVLFLYCMIAIIQAASWNFYPPIADELEIIYGWNANTITFVTNLANIMFLTSAIPWSLYADKYGMRKSVLGSAILVTLALWLRLVPCRKMNMCTGCMQAWSAMG
eukprot:UN26231